MAHDVFISYSHHDKPQADAVCATLEAKGIRCWIAPRDVIPGQEWGAAIVDAIRSSRVMVLVFSSHANASPQIRREVERAVSAETVLIPFRIEDVLPEKSLEYFLGTPHWLDALTPPLEAHLEHLAAAATSFLAVIEPAAQKAGDVHPRTSAHTEPSPGSDASPLRVSHHDAQVKIEAEGDNANAQDRSAYAEQPSLGSTTSTTSEKAAEVAPPTQVASDIEREAHLVAVAVEWASPEELAKLNIPQTERRWAVGVFNGSAFPLFDVAVALESNNGGQDLLLQCGTLAPHDLRGDTYVLNLEVADFDPDGEPPLWSLTFTIAGVACEIDLHGSVHTGAH